MRLTSFLSVLFFAIFLNISVHLVGAQSTTFTSNLTLGSTGAQVVALQQTLIAQGHLVMPAGVAYGYFGPLTKAAVAKWQAANGVSPASGYWGPVSRARYTTINSGIATNTVSKSYAEPVSVIAPTPAPPSNADVNSGLKVNQVTLFRAFPFEVRAGDVVTLEGSGFSNLSNKVYFNGSNEVSTPSASGTNMKVVVPSNLNTGEYKITVSNTLGSSDKSDFSVLIKVTNDPQPAPLIESASINGETVTIVGKGFTSSNNLFTTLGNSSRPIVSNGNTLIFNLTDLSFYGKIKETTQGKYQASLWIYVQNEHGINKDPYEIKLII